MAITNVWAQFPGGYLTDETRPTQYDFVKAPPSLTSGAFAYDFFYYQWGREQRDSADVSAQALSDEAAKLYSVYGESNCIGINLTPETTPEIILLCERAVTGVSTANTAVKNKYQRVRPLRNLQGRVAQTLDLQRSAAGRLQGKNRKQTLKSPKTPLFIGLSRICPFHFAAILRLSQTGTEVNPESWTQLKGSLQI